MTNITRYLQNNQFIYQYGGSSASDASDTDETGSVSGSSDIQGVSSSSGSSGTSGMSGIGEIIGTVDNLSISQVIELFTTGNLTIEELKKWCNSKKCSYSVSDNGTQTNIKFKYINKQYFISCNNSAMSSQTNSKEIKTYSFSDVKKYKFDENTLSKYFDIVETENGNVKKYAFKQDSKYETLESLQYAIFDEYKKNLIIQNFLNGNAVRTNVIGNITETTTNLYKTKKGTTLSLTNYTRYAEEIGKLDEKEANKLRKDALDKFVQDFSSGNLAYTQVSIILNAIGVTDTRQKSINDIYEISFKYDNKTYTITCNKEAAKSGVDAIVNDSQTGSKTYDLFKILSEKELENVLKDANQNVSTDVAKTKIDEFINISKEYLIKTLNLTSSFVDAIKDFAISELNLDEAQSINLKEALDKINTIYKSLLGKSEYWSANHYYSRDRNMTSFVLFLDNDYVKQPSNLSDSGKIQYKFLDNVIKKFLYKYYKISEDGKTRFYSRLYEGSDFLQIQNHVMEVISNKIGVSAELMTFNDIMEKLDSNSNNSWIDELYNILQKEILSFDINKFSGDAETIDAEYLIQNMSKLDSGYYGQKLYAQIQTLFDKYNIQYKAGYSQIRALNCLITLLNKEQGIQNSDKLDFSQDGLKKLSDNDWLKIIENLINSDKLSNMYYGININSQIEDFGQGNTGDCWLLAGLISLNSSEAGKKIIQDSIIVKDGNITITFKGIGLSYQISKEEMDKARLSGIYSSGDDDVLALELATEKLRLDFKSGKVNLPYGTMWNTDKQIEIGTAYSDISGGYSEFMLYYLTGNKPERSIYKKGSNYFEAYTQENATMRELLETMYKKVQTGDVVGYFAYNNHEYAIVGMTEKTITIVNPYDSSRKNEITWEEFIKLQPEQISFTSTSLHENEYNN